MRKYKIEFGKETKKSLSTIEYFSNAEDLKKFIEKLDCNIWYVVTYAKTGQEIMQRDFTKKGTIYNEFIKCPKVLENL